jgi:hypothetical protein
MNASTSRISNLIYDPGTSRVDSEVRFMALFGIISLLGTGLLAFIVCLLGITLGPD